MTYKKIFIIVLVAIAAFYVFKVKGFNPFVPKIRGDITLCQLNGQKKALDEYAGENGTLIFFMSTWCPHCAEEIERAKPLAEFFRLRKINVLIGMYGPDRDVIHSWVAKQDIPWDWKTFYWENSFESEFHLKKYATPYLTARNKDGVVTFSESGALYSDRISEATVGMLKSNQ